MEFQQRTLAQAKEEVEVLLLAEAKKRGEDWTEVSINLWYDGDPDKMAKEGNTIMGIRVAALDWGKRPANGGLAGYCGGLAGYCGGSTSDGDSVQSLAICAAAERAIMARCCYWETSDENQQWEVERADELLLEANWGNEADVVAARETLLNALTDDYADTLAQARSLRKEVAATGFKGFAHMENAVLVKCVLDAGLNEQDEAVQKAVDVLRPE